MNSAQILTKDEKLSQTCERPSGEPPTNPFQCINRNHVLFATFTDKSVTITTTTGLTLTFWGTAPDLTKWADELTENLHSNFAVLRNTSVAAAL
jgi:hypothetical protein